MPEHKSDQVGRWTEIKWNIIKDFAQEHAKILSKQPKLRFAYIDGLAGADEQGAKISGRLLPDSPAIALSTEPKFHFHHFLDMDGTRSPGLLELSGDNRNVWVYQGDCNEVLLNEVFPKCQYKQGRRALCLLDPFDLNPKWSVIQKAGSMQSVDIFWNFMVKDAQMNPLWQNPGQVSETRKQGMNDFWGDDSWISACASPGEGALLSDPDPKGQKPDEAILEAYRTRIKDMAGFKFVPKPIPMKNKSNRIIYYLFFASNNQAGNRIAKQILKNFQRLGDKEF